MSHTNVNLLSHPLVSHHLAKLRDAATAPAEFRAVVRRLTFLLAFEATRDLHVREARVRTPLKETTAAVLAQRIALVPILRAGMGMVEAALDLLPEAEVWHLGIYRDEQTLRPVEYYSKVPRECPPDVALILDPMLATGGSACWALEAMKRWGVKRIKQLSLIASQAGAQVLAAQHGDVEVHVCAIDAELNERGFIVPGLGDAGDRIYGTQTRPAV